MFCLLHQCGSWTNPFECQVVYGDVRNIYGICQSYCKRFFLGLPPGNRFFQLSFDLDV